MLWILEIEVRCRAAVEIDDLPGRRGHPDLGCAGDAYDPVVAK
jgi:hypothetical protein